MRRRLGVATTLAAALLATVMPAAAVPASAGGGSGSAGSDGVGDPFFPQAGNGGYDVQDYDVTATWDPATQQLQATTVVSATATQDLSQFDLDLRGFTVSSVKVDGRTASFTRSGQELVITPAKALRARSHFRVQVVYAGTPEVVIDPDGSPEGWMPTSDGIVALGEPQGSPAWFPANDHPTDKATFSLSMTVPKELTVVSNGEPQQPIRRGGQVTYRWHEDDPMATYLATVSIGHFTVSTAKLRSGLLVYTAVVPALGEDSAASIARIPEMIEWLEGIYGRYPFDSTGAIVVDAPDVGYELETQSRPTFTSAPDDGVMVHELAHQWVGDSVSISSWPDIWLNEGFAGYTEWLWSEHDGGPTADELFTENYDGIPADDPFWQTPPLGLPDASELFSDVVYTRGAMALHELRLAVGDATFFRILRTWTVSHRDGNVTTAQFQALAERLSHRDLDALFTSWLATPGKPAR